MSVHTFQASFGTLLIAVCATLPYLTPFWRRPTLAAVIHIELIIVSMALLLWCFRFRDLSFALDDVPQALPRFVDLSMTLAAAVIAVAKLPGSSVTLGPIPPWLIAVGPPLLIAAVVYFSSVRPLRESTARWAVCLWTSLVAAGLVLPTQELLRSVMVPLVKVLPLPSP